MDTSSAQQTYSITLDDTIDLSDTITGIIAQDLTTAIDSYVITGSSDVNMVSTTYTSGSSNTITIDSSLFSNVWITTVPFENGFPEWEDFQNMCKEYPGLEQAYEKLKTFYELCKDEWAHKKKGLK